MRKRDLVTREFLDQLHTCLIRRQISEGVALLTPLLRSLAAVNPSTPYAGRHLRCLAEWADIGLVLIEQLKAALRRFASEQPPSEREDYVGYKLAQAFRCHLTGQNDAALEHLEIVLKLAREVRSAELEMETLFLMGRCFAGKGNYKAASDYLTKSEELAAANGLEGARGVILTALASVDLDRGQQVDARSSLTKAQKILASTSDAVAKAACHAIFAKLQRREGRLELSLEAWEAAQKQLDKYQFAPPQLLGKIHMGLALTKLRLAERAVQRLDELARAQAEERRAPRFDRSWVSALARQNSGLNTLLKDRSVRRFLTEIEETLVDPDEVVKSKPSPAKKGLLEELAALQMGAEADLANAEHVFRTLQNNHGVATAIWGQGLLALSRDLWEEAGTLAERAARAATDGDLLAVARANLLASKVSLLKAEQEGPGENRCAYRRAAIKDARNALCLAQGTQHARLIAKSNACLASALMFDGGLGGDAVEARACVDAAMRIPQAVGDYLWDMVMVLKHRLDPPVHIESWFKDRIRQAVAGKISLKAVLHEFEMRFFDQVESHIGFAKAVEGLHIGGDKRAKFARAKRTETVRSSGVDQSSVTPPKDGA